MRTITRHIPNFLTCCNLFCGCLAIIQIFKGSMVNAAYLVFTGALFDFFDGLAARLLKAPSAIGKDLDSLADMVTFGLVPGYVMYQLLGLYSTNVYLPNLALLIPVFSALRLAIFNNDPRQSTDFYGLPTPANALFFVSLPLILIFDKTPVSGFFQNAAVLSAVVLAFCYCMVSDIRLFSLKIKSLNLKDNVYVVALIVAANLLFFFLFYAAIPFIIVLYIILSLVKNALER